MEEEAAAETKPAKDELLVRPTGPQDSAAVLEIARELARDGSTYVFPEDAGDEELLGYFLAPAGWNFVATRAGRVLGCYVLRANHAGRGGHVANASYAVAESARGQGVGKALGEHSLAEARRRGFLAIQFNFVVGTNQAALGLWRELGFAIVGTLPAAFRHPRLGLVDAHVMHRFL